MVSGTMNIAVPVLLCHQDMDPVKTPSFTLRPYLKEHQRKDPALMVGGGGLLGACGPTRAQRLLLGRWGLKKKWEEEKKAQNNNWQWVDGGMLRVRSTGNCAELHNRDLHLFTLLLWLHSSEASLEGSHSTQSANCLGALSASAQKASATLSRAMKRREEQGRGNVG